MNHPRLSIIFSSLHPPFLLPSPFENSPRSRSNFVLYVSSAGERGKRRDRKEHPANIVEKFVPRFPHSFHGKWRYVPVYFKFSPRNFGFVPRLDCLSPSLSFLFTSSSTSRSHNFSALSAKLAVYPREENERNNETSFRDATEDPTIFRWDDISLLF